MNCFARRSDKSNFWADLEIESSLGLQVLIILGID